MDKKNNEILIEDLTSIEFGERDEILFPDVCIICGKRTESRIEVRKIGKFSSNKSFRNNYYFKFPICDECKLRLKIKTGFDNIIIKLLILITIIGAIVGLILGLLTHSIVMALTIPLSSFLIPFFLYLRSIKDKLHIDDYFNIEIIPGEDEIIRFSFLNSQYAKFIKNHNPN